MECYSPQLVLFTSLKIVFVWGAMHKGGVLFPLRWLLESILNLLPLKVEMILCKPFYDCLFCMSSVWGTLFTIQYFSFSWAYLQLLLTIGGLNYILQYLLDNERKKD